LHNLAGLNAHDATKPFKNVSTLAQGEQAARFILQADAYLTGQGVLKNVCTDTYGSSGAVDDRCD